MKTEVERGGDVNRLLAAAVACPEATISISVQHDAGLEAFLSDDPVDQRVLIACSDPSWPSAVPPSLIVSTPADWKRRAGVIVNAYLNVSLSGKKFLDFGCGNGMVVEAASEAGAAVAVGYDVARDPAWVDGGKTKLTTDWQAVVDSAPYDIALMFDVFDHIDQRTWVAECSKLVSVLKPGGLLYFRGHPWSSRHGGHIYRKLNKAYVHLMLSDALNERLADSTPPKTRMLFRPTYENFWKSRIPGVTVSAVDIVDTPVEAVIAENRYWMNLIWERTFKANDAQELLRNGLREHLSAEFVDLVIRKH